MLHKVFSAVVLWAAAMLPTFGAQVFVAGKGGIYEFELNSANGQLQSKGKAADVSAPSFLALHPESNFLYCANNASSGGQALSFLILPDNGLIELSSVETGGKSAAFVEVDQRGKYLFAANYSGGSVAGFKLEPDGRIGVQTTLAQHEGSSVHPSRQTEPHPHAARFSPDNQFLYVPDLGTDDVFIYKINHFDGSLSSAIDPWSKVGEGSGPRHIDFHPNLDMAYVINELQSTISVFKRQPQLGALTSAQTISTLPAGFSGRNSTAEIRVHPSGKFLYGSNRGHDSIAVFAIDSSGFLKVVEHESTLGKTPRHFTIDPEGKWLIVGNQNSDTLAVFAINPRTGALTPSNQLVNVPGPKCIVVKK